MKKSIHRLIVPILALAIFLFLTLPVFGIQSIKIESSTTPILCIEELAQEINTERTKRQESFMLETVKSSSDVLSGECGDNLNWTYNAATCELVIFGTGDMYNYENYWENRRVPWYSFIADIQTVVLEEGLTSVGDEAFERCSNLSCITIPKGVSYIGRDAFSECTNLTSVFIPDGVTSIGGGAFGYCSSLKSVTIPKGVTDIYDYTFTSCSNLENVIIPQGVNSIGRSAFNGCSKLSSIAIPEGVNFIGEYAFHECTSLTNASIPGSVSDIKYCAFYDCSNLSSVIIGEGVISIGGQAFYNCKRLKNLIIPDSVTTISYGAFWECSNLTNVTIGKGVSSIYSSAFSCTAITRVDITDLGAWCNIKFDDSFSNPLYGQASLYLNGVPVQELVIPDGVSFVGNYTFCGCGSLTSVHVPEGVTGVGEGAFSDCNNLTCVIIPSTVTSVDEDAFGRSYPLTTIIILNPLCQIYDDEYTFGGWIGNETTFYSDIGSTAQNYAESYGHSFVPLSDENCENGIHCYFNGHCFLCNSQYIISGTFGEYITWILDVAEGSLTISGKGEVRDSVSFTAPWENYNYLIKTVELDDTISRIGEYVFYGCRNLTSITVPSSVTTIDRDAFAHCSKLQHVHFMDDMPALDDTAFFKCSVDLELCYIEGTKGWEDCPYATEVWDYTSTTDCEVVTYTCNTCGEVYAHAKGGTHNWVQDENNTVLPTCTQDGIFAYRCSLCENTKTESSLATGHSYSYTNSGETHTANCSRCADSFTAAHSYTGGKCVCGAEEYVAPSVDESIVINHTLNLASDISVNYAIKGELLAAYDSYYLEVLVPVYIGNVRTGNTTVSIQPVQNGGYYYFTLTGITAVQMNDTLLATLRMSRDGKEYVSNADSYGIAVYAYNQLNKGNASKALKTLCADLLRYGAAAQTYKGYRTDALATDALTAVQQGYLSDLNAVTFGNTNTTFNDLSAPMITWAGKALNLDSKVVVKFIFDVGAYTGDLSNLTLRLAYRDNAGTYRTATLTNPGVYDESKRLYAFDFDGLMAAELRTALSATIYAGSTQVSRTLQYSADTYGNNKTGTLLQVCKALFAYSDSAKAYFVS